MTSATQGPQHARQPRSARGRNDAASQRTVTPSQTLPRRVQVPQCAIFPAPAAPQGRLTVSTPVAKDKAHHPTMGDETTGSLIVGATKKLSSPAAARAIRPSRPATLSRTQSRRAERARAGRPHGREHPGQSPEGGGSNPDVRSSRPPSRPPSQNALRTKNASRCLCIHKKVRRRVSFRGQSDFRGIRVGVRYE